MANTNSTNERMSANRGSKLVTAATITKDFYAFQADEDAVITELYYKGDLVTNIITTYMPAGGTLHQGSTIFINNTINKTFGKIVFGSGQLILHS
jgi:hypothetical protein